ncbi:ornithine decarboxylase 1-like isoform X4 [Vespa crabro]|uniref:ornithine decarboxylase 1-like isoform X4 n=1 Tax=Vespa crabro TaxID=7445 RepID=UPI001F004BAD|nr:ornithine decarboxylase 1-like isoform X4 [Vespa crabro]
MSKMSSVKVSDIYLYEGKIYEDQFEEFDIFKNIIKSRDQEDAFYILDLGVIIKKNHDWIKKMPRVVPYYAVKCNPHPMVIKVLAAMNGNFDCASKQEIQQVMEVGVSSDRIIFANPTKFPSHIKFAKSVGVEKMTVDGKCELYKIKKLFPEAKIVIRFRCDGNSTVARCLKLGIKFGCEPGDEAKELIQLTKDLDLILYGFSFHVGSPCVDFNAYISHIINDAIKDIDPTIEIISEPGRYYVTSAFTLASVVHSKKTVSVGNSLKQMYYVSCGVYSGFIDELLNMNSRQPIPLSNSISDKKKYSSSIWGPTLDSLDCIIKDVLLPEFQIGDWFIWKDMGAYTNTVACKFNGFMPPEVYPFIRKSQWEELCAIIRLNV